jgi:hypothetical protein
MIIKENTICYTSELGHNNFWYPSNSKLLIKKTCSVEKVAWLSGGSKVPVRLLKSCLLPIDITESTTTNISPPTKNDYTIVWIERHV